MAAVLSAVSATLDNPDAHYLPSECLSIAELQLRTGQLLKARSLAQHSAVAPRSAPLKTSSRAQAHLFLAGLCRKESDFIGCCRALQAGLLDSGVSDPLFAQLHLMLAKLYEHRLADLAQAALHARHTAALEGVAGQQHRLARLQRKLKAQPSAGREPAAQQQPTA
jgi:hypothetical protein